MEAVQDESIDHLASLEERITRAVQVITSLRSENSEMQQRIGAVERELVSAKADLSETQALSAEFQKENGVLEQKVAQLLQEVESMRGERKQVKHRIEKLLDQLDLLSAS